MGLSTAERNRRKRERKKKEKETRRREEEEEKKLKDLEKLRGEEQIEVEIEYVTEEVTPTAGMAEIMEKFQERAALQTTVVTDEEEKGLSDGRKKEDGDDDARDDYGYDDDDDDDDDDESKQMSKRKLREASRPTVAALKRRVQNPDLVEAHDVTARDPEFLILLKGVPGAVPVPRHWGRKRKYLQGKRGFEKPPFQLPDFIVKTGITEIRDTVADAENDMNAKQKNRSRVAPKMGHMDVDYRTLHEAFFKHQTKPENLTIMGDLYYEGKEMETRNTIKPGGPLSDRLKEALGISSDHMPPPWLVNMQRYGPPPSYPTLKIPGLNAPLPTNECQFGYHVGGWGKPPVDNFNRPLYGGNPFDPPGHADKNDGIPKEGLVTSDGKTLTIKQWGALPHADMVQDEESSEEEEEESSDEEMEESDEEEGEETESGIQSVVAPPVTTKAVPTDLRKEEGNETPFVTVGQQQPKQLYQVLGQHKAGGQSSQVFGSEIAYTMPPEGAESVLSKAPVEPSKKKRRTDDDDDDGDLGKNFKF